MNSHKRIALLILLLLASGIVNATSLWGPVLSNVTPTSAQIVWRDGDTPAQGVSFGDRVYAGTVDTKYRTVTLTHLTPDMAYSYDLLEKNRERVFAFRTAPATKATPFTFAVYGDTRSQPAIHQQVVTAILAVKPRFVINTGDLVESGSSTSAWEHFFAVAAPLTGSLPYLPVPGNHEGNASDFYRLFPITRDTVGHERYVYTYGCVRVIGLNSTQHLSEQRVWLDRYLTDHAGETPWTVVAFHYPPFSSYARHGDAQIRQQWVPILEKHHVDAVFLGHDHFYEHSKKAGVQYFITGGGGAPLYDPNVTHNAYQQHAEKVYNFLRVDAAPTTLRIQMIRLNGTVGESVMLTK